jgi:hypothetical protein
MAGADALHLLVLSFCASPLYLSVPSIRWLSVCPSVCGLRGGICFSASSQPSVGYECLPNAKALHAYGMISFLRYGSQVPLGPKLRLQANPSVACWLYGTDLQTICRANCTTSPEGTTYGVASHPTSWHSSIQQLCCHST